ncbi:MAG: OmpA family protein [Myxococcales bacterium]|nr:OmpA family protein [Myxococcota bacterium]MDW8280285.1 OmpA family protein [Myxococcales bacterium]
MNANARCSRLLWVLVVLFSVRGAAAWAQSAGFQLNRYEPTPSGEWSFAVDHPWFSGTRYFSAGFTLNYAHNPLVFGIRSSDGSFAQREVVLQHLLLGHFDLALSLWDRITLSTTVPLTMAERGQALAGVVPQEGAHFGDPRIGLMVRIVGQPDASPISLSLGSYLWIPIGTTEQRTGDATARVLPKLVLAGLVREHFRWSFTSGFYYRPEATLGNLPDPTGSSVGPALQFGALLQYADLLRRYAVGPEAILYTTVTNGRAFGKDFTNLELLLGAHYHLGGLVQTSLALGTGMLRDPGTPDVRLLFRLAYAPLRPRDRDGDGIPDREDACPDRRGWPDRDPRQHGCPPRDRDQDGVLDPDDLCPDDPQGHQPDPRRHGCPERDTDRDGVLDSEDLCPNDPQGRQPDPMRRGCPAPDRDRDGVPDREDACPDEPGSPHRDPKRHGCAGKVRLDPTAGKLIVLEPVYFATNRDVILRRSFPVLQEVADVLRLSPELGRISIEGHTDNRGPLEYNMSLSERRAHSVRRWLIQNGIPAERLEAHGFGPTRPIATNDTPDGRQQNRRVEFIILGPSPLQR